MGEHHRADFAVSAPDVVLAGLATVTDTIRLGTAVTVLSSDDPIRVFERFSTIDAMSEGRADIILGRGSFIESFPLFGFDLAQYEELFSEKLDLFAALLPEEPVTWSGELRPPLENQEVYPRTENGMTAWVAVGGSPESVIRAARYKMPLMLAVIGGNARRFRPFADLYRQANEQLGNGDLPIGVHSPGFVADTDEEARELLMPHWLENRNAIGKERGWGPAGPDEFISEVRHGALPSVHGHRRPQNRRCDPGARLPLRPQYPTGPCRTSTSCPASTLRHRGHPAGAPHPRARGLGRPSLSCARAAYAMVTIAAPPTSAVPL